MGPKQVELALAAIDLLQLLIPQIKAAVKTGDINTVDQQKVRDRYNALRASGDAAFTGPEWEVE